MARSVVRWSVRLAVLAGVIALVGRVLAGRPGLPGAGAGPGNPAPDGMFPAITGDTWPPVPVNPDRGG
jgi:hypothetical protein